MNVPYLLSQISKGKWFLSPWLLNDYQYIVSGIINGSLGVDVEREPLDVYAINPRNGDKTSVFDEAPKGSIALIPFKGVMLKEDGLCSYGTESIANRMIEAAMHKNICGLVTINDSGGGAVDAIAPIAYASAKVKLLGKSLVGLADMSASANYYTISYCDHIMADNNISSEFGSIGVMMSWADVQPYYERLGVVFRKVYSNESTYKNKPFEMALKGEYDLIKEEMLDPLARQFQKDVRINRQGKVNITVEGILKGKMFYAEEAKEYGLIDSIGNLEKAVELAHKLSNQNK